MFKAHLKLNYAYCMDQVLGEGKGLSKSLWQNILTELISVHYLMEDQRRTGKLSFWELPKTSEQELLPILEQADRLRMLADDLVILGIGGSVLGTNAVSMALSGGLRQIWPQRKKRMRLHIADNPDPRVFGNLLERLNLKRTAFNVISKSGSTAETMAQFMIIWQRLEKIFGPEEAKRRLIFTTDPKISNLNILVRHASYIYLPVPSNVSGRYSVLSAVGLLPLACAGYDIHELLAGAKFMAERCLERRPQYNPAYVFAALTVAYARLGRNILVIMPYASDLFGLAQWFVQLWAESLGKTKIINGTIDHVGQTPVIAVGSTDQHGQLQLYMEGPQDKLVFFINLDNYGDDIEIPHLFSDIESLAYLGGRRLSELMQAGAQATAAALAIRGRPSLSLRLPEVSEHVLGEVFFLLEAATVAAGGLLNINPLDQPGVELGKKFTYSLMGRKGFNEHRQWFETIANIVDFLV